MSQLRRRTLTPLLHPGNVPTRRGTVGTIIIIAVFVGAAGLGLAIASQHHGVGPTARSFEVSVSNDKMIPSRLQVRDGDQVVLSITGERSETFILLNLVFSVQAAFTGPVLLLSGNRQAQKDRLTLEHAASVAEAEESATLEILEEIERNTEATLKVIEHLRKRRETKGQAPSQA